MASRRCARRRVAPGRALRGCRRAGGRRRPRYASCHMALAASSRAGGAYGCPGSGVWRRFSGVARTGRSNVAARGGAGLVAGRIIGESGGVWQRLRGGAGGNCANAGSARPRYVGRCGAPSHSGGARHAFGLASVVSGNGTFEAILTCRERPGAGKRSAPGASDRDPIGPRPLAGSGRRSRLERGRRRRPDETLVCREGAAHRIRIPELWSTRWRVGVARGGLDRPF